MSSLLAFDLFWPQSLKIERGTLKCWRRFTQWEKQEKKEGGWGGKRLSSAVVKIRAVQRHGRSKVVDSMGMREISKDVLVPALESSSPSNHVSAVYIRIATSLYHYQYASPCACSSLCNTITSQKPWSPTFDTQRRVSGRSISTTPKSVSVSNQK